MTYLHRDSVKLLLYEYIKYSISYCKIMHIQHIEIQHIEILKQKQNNLMG